MEGQNPPMNAPVTSTDRHPWLRIPDLIAINVIVVIAAGAAVASMMESYTNLLDFALNHELHGWRADIAPGAVDSFIIIGELLLFVAVYRTWNIARTTGRDHRVPASMVVYGWALAAFGFTLSVLGNLGHLNDAGTVTRLMSAVFPVSATVALAAVLMILKRVVQDYRAQSQPDIRPHGELLYQLGGFPEPRPVASTPVVPGPKRRKRPAVAAPEPQPALAVAPPPELPRMVPDPDPRQGQVSRPIEITSSIWAKLTSGVTAEKLAADHPELGSRFRVGQIVKAYQEGRLGHGQLVDETPVVVVPDYPAEASGGE